MSAMNFRIRVFQVPIAYIAQFSGRFSHATAVRVKPVSPDCRNFLSQARQGPVRRALPSDGVDDRARQLHLDRPAEHLEQDENTLRGGHAVEPPRQLGEGAGGDPHRVAPS